MGFSRILDFHVEFWASEGVKDMLRSDEGQDVFFDTVNSSSFEDSVIVKEDLVTSRFEYEIWRNEPKSIRERRESFLCRMGFAESYNLPSNSQEKNTKLHSSSKMIELERRIECSGAVSSSCPLVGNLIEATSVCNERAVTAEANCMVDELGNDLVNMPKLGFADQITEVSNRTTMDVHEKKKQLWWKNFINKKKRKGSACISKGSVLNSKTPMINRLKVQQNKKRCKEFTALYHLQEIQAHKGFIWTMKFSPDGQYLASGGSDGAVRIWRVTSADASSKLHLANGVFGSKGSEGNSTFRTKKSSHASVIIPDKVFQLEESPMQECLAHGSDVLDLAWSESNLLLSSSEDKTVRLWQLGSDECLGVFHHNDYVTCIQFNPVDDNYFISGSIDGKVRVWVISEGRVVDWVDMRDVVTAICYQPDAKGFLVGSITGSCRFYSSSGKHLVLETQVHIRGRKKATGNKITGIQFSTEEPQRAMITSEDSKVRLFDGIDVIHKYKGLRKSGSQRSASFTSSGRHIISVGEDSRVYLWNYDSCRFSSPKQVKSVSSCEHFLSEDVSLAIPYTGLGKKASGSSDSMCCLQRQNHVEAASWIRDSDRFSLGNWFLMDGPCKGSSATWPEEKLPLLDDASMPEHDHHYDDHQYHHDHQGQHQSKNFISAALPETWGLVIVTAGWDGIIRTIHNYGLPVRI